MKNIPIANKRTYLNMTIQAADKFIRNLEWRTHFYLNPRDTPNMKENYGFKSLNAPPRTPELRPFEDSLLHLIQNIEFSTISNPYLNTLKNEVKKIEKDPNLIISADKTSNFYKMKPEKYQELLEKNIHKEYKKMNQMAINKVNTSHIEVVNKLDIQDRVFATTPRQAYVTLKDHKDNFNNNPSCRLINPTKPEIGRVSSKILQKINAKVRQATKHTQWRNSAEVIQWFKNLKNKSTLKFIIFDICNFYPSITPELLLKALEWASQFVKISIEEKEAILEARKCFLFCEGKPWAKKTNSNFDVTMGAWDGSECCEIVGLYILEKLKILKLMAGLYRDDGLGVSSATPRQLENIKKEICAVSKKRDYPSQLKQTRRQWISWMSPWI